MTVPSWWRFSQVIEDVNKKFKENSRTVHTDKWQAMDIRDRPEMATYELLNYSFMFPLTEDLDILRAMIKPNLPWADHHFLERVCGQPINPGIQWEHWPYGASARKVLEKDGGKFNHNYMERYWPKNAGQVSEPTLTAMDYSIKLATQPQHVNDGIYHRYGDLNDVVNQIASDPLTRQAYMPVFFPEDTGAVHGGRIPCTLGYHFIVRDGKLHTIYYLRSCDYVRHFRDDVYLTVRLALWVLGELRTRDDKWKEVKLGNLTMHITSFHIFRNDYANLFGAK